MTTANTNGGQLVLFTPSENIAEFFTAKELKDSEGAVVGSSYAIAKRKDIAKALDIDPRKQSALLDKEVLKVTDAAKADMGKVVMNIVASRDFTGGRLTIRKNKQGLRAVTARFVEVKRDETPSMTPEQVAALTGESVEVVKAKMEAQAKKQASNTVTIEATAKPVAQVPTPAKA